MLDLLASNCDKESFLSISSIFYVTAYLLNALSVFTTLNSSQQGSSESKSMSFKSLIYGFSMYVL